MRDFRAAGLRYGVHKCTPRTQGSPWFGTLTEREQAALAFSQGVEPKALARNISQSVTRVPTSSTVGEGQDRVHLAPTFLPGQLLWLELETQEPRVLLGREALAMQGFPVNENPKLAGSFEESLMQNLAGNAMNMLVVLALLQACLEAVPWARTPDPEAVEEGVDMEAVISLLFGDKA